MTDIEIMHNELANIEDEIRELEEARKELSQKIADTLCPFSVGERVTNNQYDYEITRIVPKGWKPYWELRGAKLKKDGTPGKNKYSHIYSFRSEITKIT